MAMGRQGIRFPISAIAVVGLGALVALAVGVSLYLGLSSATENTRRFMAHRAETLVDGLEQRIASELRPVVRQARWTVEQIERGRLKLDDSQALDAFVRGTLGVTPQVAEIGITGLRGPNRRWGRESAHPIIEDWSDRPAVAAWLDAGVSSRGPTWHAPFWSRTLGATVLLLDTPIRIDGEFAGVFSQAVTISKLSLHIASVSAATGAMPFILYDRNHVLAHPLLISWAPEETDRDHPLVALNALGDAVLERIWTPEQEQLRLLGGLTATRSSGATVGDDFYVYLYRDIERYGPKPWTIGVYRSVRASDTFEWLSDVARSVLSGSFDDSGLADGGEVARVVAAVLVGITVLVISVALAAWIGARASRPLRALAAAARSVESGQLERVPALPPSRVAELDDVNRSFNGMVAGLEERELIRETLGRFVPTDIARSLLSDGGELTPEQSEATVLFCDLEGFTALTESLGPAGIVDLLNEYFEAMVGILERYRGVVTQFQGDAILATFNVPVRDPAHAANALRAAVEMQAAVRTQAFAGLWIGCRIGINTGLLYSGTVGARGRYSYTVHGDAVNLAARLEALNKELGTSILVSGATAALTENFDLVRVGEVDVRGQTGRVAVYTPGDPPG